MLRFGGVKKNSPAAQTVFCPDPPNPPLLSAFTRGADGCGFGSGERRIALLAVGSGVTLTPTLSRAAGEGARRIQTRSKKEAEWSKWPKEQAGLEAVGKRAVEPSASRHRHNRQNRLGQAERSAGPSERSESVNFSNSDANFMHSDVLSARKVIRGGCGRGVVIQPLMGR